MPIALYIAKHDRIIYADDSRDIVKLFGESIVDIREIDGGHIAFMVGKDMSYFKENVMNVIKKYNPIQK